MRARLPRLDWRRCWPTGRCWPILAFLGVGCRRRCVNPPVGSCASWEDQQPRPCQRSRGGGADHRAAQAVEGIGDGVSWAAGQVPQGDPDGGRVGKAADLRKAIMNIAHRVIARMGLARKGVEPSFR